MSRIEIGPEALDVLIETVAELAWSERVVLVADATPAYRDGEDLKERIAHTLSESFEFGVYLQTHYPAASSSSVSRRSQPVNVPSGPVVERSEELAGRALEFAVDGCPGDVEQLGKLGLGVLPSCREFEQVLPL